MRSVVLAIAYLLINLPAQAQWMFQQSNTTASLRGIDAPSPRIAWASGTEGTILRTVNNGETWTRCTTPPNANKLDFRGIVAKDQNTAIVMSSGPGDNSRIYKTTDGCQTWKLVFTNPDAPAGFFDAIRFTSRTGEIVGDPVNNAFAVFRSNDQGNTWTRSTQPTAQNKEGLFAASNTSLIALNNSFLFVTGGPASRSVADDYLATDLPLRHGESAGAFSVASGHGILVAVGGDYKQPDNREGTCAISKDKGLSWNLCTTSPNGYRSAVAYDVVSSTWITVGPNGTDISIDDGQNWTSWPHAPDGSDKDWNALSLPFVVGPHGRIARLSSIRKPSAMQDHRKPGQH